jgi:ABC-type polysaccharide/polyol phosphate transport system ATPase subunit
LTNATVDFPIYGANGRSIKRRLLRLGTGSRVDRDARDRVVVRALRNVSLDLKCGDRVGIVGPNGAGKSTLLRVLAGIYELSSGTLFAEGKVTTLFNLNLGFDPEATGYENIVLRGLAAGLDRRSIDGKVEEIARFAGLGDHLELPLHTYSAGMRVRLAFAVATSVDPEILLIDEVIGAGDREFMVRARQRLNDFVGRAGIVVLSTHNAGIMKRLCNRVVRLNEGRIEAVGAPEKILG